jgi:hypothetical protein
MYGMLFAPVGGLQLGEDFQVEFFRQVEEPVDQQAPSTQFVGVQFPLCQRNEQVQFRLRPLLVVAARPLRLQMGEQEQPHRVLHRPQLVLLAGPLQELDRLELERVRGIVVPLDVSAGRPVGAVVAEDDQRLDRLRRLLAGAVVVGADARGEFILVDRLRLHLRVEDAVVAAEQPHPDQRVREARPHLRVGRDLAQLLLERVVVLSPVDLREQFREQQHQHRRC